METVKVQMERVTKTVGSLLTNFLLAQTVITSSNVKMEKSQSQRKIMRSLLIISNILLRLRSLEFILFTG